MKRKVMLKLFFAFILVILVLMGIFAISVHQASESIPPRCELFNGTCAASCNGMNFKEPGLKEADCIGGKICCLG